MTGALQLNQIQVVARMHNAATFSSGSKDQSPQADSSHDVKTGIPLDSSDGSTNRTADDLQSRSQYKTAKALGLTITPELMVRATLGN